MSLVDVDADFWQKNDDVLKAVTHALAPDLPPEQAVDTAQREILEIGLGELVARLVFMAEHVKEEGTDGQ